MTTTNQRPLVLYHDHCTDGYGAAFAAWCKLGDAAEYVPVKYGDPAPDVTGREVYVLDFSYSEADTERFIEQAKRFVWLDHHKTAFEMYCKNGERELYQLSADDLHILLDNNKSGAMLAWEYFCPTIAVPRIIQRIDDRDRWVFQYPDSKAMHAGLQTMKPWSFAQWKALTPMGTTDWHRNLNDVTSAGAATLQVHKGLIDGAVKRSTECSIVLSCWYAEEVPGFTREDGYDRVYGGLSVNSPVLQSEIGHELANTSGTYGLVWYYDGTTGRANCSLRSNGDYDVSAIAKRFGGGGHKNAAGFNIDMPTLLGWVKP